MLDEPFNSGLQLLAMVGLCGILRGVFVLIGVVAAGREPFDMIKGVALIALGVYLAGLGHEFSRPAKTDGSSPRVVGRRLPD